MAQKAEDLRKTAYATRVRLAPGEKDLLARLAAEHDIAAAEVIRRCLRAVGEGEAFDPWVVRTIEEQLRRIGVNLNQIARRYNSGQVVADSELAEALEQVAEILARTIRGFREMTAAARAHYQTRIAEATS